MTSLTPAEVRELYEAAQAALAHSYAKYSRFRVAAALRTRSGEIITGVNVENAAYPQTLCAERTAIVSAVSQGHREFTDIAIIYRDEEHPDSHSPIRPCGGCLSVMLEFSPQRNLRVHCLSPHGQPEILSLAELLPYPFEFRG